MAVDILKDPGIVLSATGPAGQIPHPNYCMPQCYAKGKRDLSGSCQCKGCHGNAHGRGKKYAFDHGYLKHSPVVSRRPQPGQESLFPEGGPDPAEVVDQP